MNTKIPKGTPYRLSTLGHYNFYYPHGDTLITQNPINATRLYWISGSSEKAYKITPTSIDDFPSKILVIWVKREHLE